MSPKNQQFGLAFAQVPAKSSARAAIDQVGGNPLAQLIIEFREKFIENRALSFFNVLADIFGFLPALERHVIGMDQLEIGFRKEFRRFFQRNARRLIESVAQAMLS